MIGPWHYLYFFSFQRYQSPAVTEHSVVGESNESWVISSNKQQNVSFFYLLILSTLKITYLHLLIEDLYNVCV